MTLQVLLKESATVNPELTRDLIDMWVPRCYRQGPGPAFVHSCLFMRTLTFRRAKMHLLPTWDISLGHQMNSEDRDTLHFTSMFV